MSFFDKNVQMKLARSLVTKTSPAYVQYYLTARCNTHCQQCNIIYAQADCPEMNIHQIRKMAENLAEIGVCIVLLIGGEPFMRRDLPDVVKAFIDNDIHVRMQTNGLASGEMLEKCVAVGGSDISVSLDSMDAETQDAINCLPKSWERTLETVANINELFPEEGKAFFGTVLMPRNVEDLPGVLEFATAIGWHISLVPCHTTTPARPLGFRAFDKQNICKFPQSSFPRLKQVLTELQEMRNQGHNLYDSDEYLDDIYRFIIGKPVQWRRRNYDICDSPYLYFAIEPNGNIQPCCDYKLERQFPIYEQDFPRLFRSGEIHEEIRKFTAICPGCMYGSYPEITLTTRFLKPFFHRFRFFMSEKRCELKRLNKMELLELAREIQAKRAGGPVTEKKLCL